jgi:hypothetical protein
LVACWGIRRCLRNKNSGDSEEIKKTAIGGHEVYCLFRYTEKPHPTDENSSEETNNGLSVLADNANGLGADHSDEEHKCSDD